MDWKGKNICAWTRKDQNHRNTNPNGSKYCVDTDVNMKLFNIIIQFYFTCITQMFLEMQLYLDRKASRLLYRVSISRSNKPQYVQSSTSSTLSESPLCSFYFMLIIIEVKKKGKEVGWEGMRKGRRHNRNFHNHVLGLGTYLLLKPFSLFSKSLQFIF